MEEENMAKPKNIENIENMVKPRNDKFIQLMAFIYYIL
jgi:hypothetical protein